MSELYQSKEFWESSPKGTTHYIPNDSFVCECWVKFDGEKYYYSYSQYEPFTVWPNGANFKDQMIPNPFLSETFSEGELPPVGIVCEALWNSNDVPGDAEYKKVKIIAHDGEYVVYKWLEGARVGSIEPHTPYTDYYGNPSLRPIQPKVKDMVKEHETVPKWKFDCLVKELEICQKKLNESQHLENKIKMFVDKDVWFWENGGENHLESLVCPVVIDADVLRSLIKTGKLE